MNKFKSLITIIIVVCLTNNLSAQETYIPWKNGKLVVDEGNRYLKHENGTPFFWLGETGWYLPARLNRDEAEYYLEQCKQKGYNVVQVMVMNTMPAINAYGKWALPEGFNFENIDKKGEYGYWDHMDYIIETAARKGIYIGMVCVWGTPVQQGKMSTADARKYGEFLAKRYKDSPNIIWLIGGDIRGDVKTEVWDALANSIRAIDKHHLMTYHPRGRTMSGTWFHNEHWLDFNMFQSGHRRYGQRKGDGEYPIEENTEEDNWRFVERSFALEPLKPVIDGEPIYEDIPHGLHNPNEVKWNDDDVRRYAYWSVFAGSFGHTYGHNSIMQMKKDGIGGAYGAQKTWYEALNDPGINQMKYLKNLMLTFPYFERVPDQTVIAGTNGIRYDRLIATRGNDYLLVYNYTGRPMEIDLTKISGNRKKVWWYSPKDGALSYIGEFDNKVTGFSDDDGYRYGKDTVLIAVDASKEYISSDWDSLPDAQEKLKK
ncbi:putative cellulases [Proteiniphilum saccharofermentans]|uniref:Putative cellulases n=1 Tax=Proteiniphilum saccharofermentans TaxID=1642647 RepID=A0A1R3T5M4_9BACT|nr:glycoside hydrolase family 140 protein [Proteiniphilum saccharofermentans]SCD21502.1 putative cellulases [Proteiniphilum saccharofermentans]